MGGSCFLYCCKFSSCVLSFEISRPVLSYSLGDSLIVFRAGIEALPISFFKKHRRHYLGSFSLTGSIELYLLSHFFFCHSAFLSKIGYGIVILGMSTLNIFEGSFWGKFGCGLDYV